MSLAAWRIVIVLLTALSACAAPEPNTPVADEALPPGIFESIPPQQQDPLADRVVTFDEYEAAVFAVASCLRDAGVRTLEPSLDENRLFAYYEYGFSAVDDPEGEIHDACYDRYLSLIDVVWVTQNESDTGDLRSAELEKLKDCLRSVGLDVAPDAGEGDLFLQYANDEHAAVAGSCFADYKS